MPSSNRQANDMSPITIFKQSPSRWRSLAALALAGVAVSSSVFSDASFTAASATPGSSYATGTVRVTNSKAGSEIASTSGMRPGQTRQGTVVVTNSGTVGATLKLESAGLSDTPSSPALSSVMNLKVEDITASAQTVYDGKLGSLSQASLGSFTAGEARTYRFTYSWPAVDNDPALQGATTTSQFRWSATT